LGRVKFLFPNHNAVYLHDTPQRGAFGRSNRSLSHGCIRVEKHFELALALLHDQGWDATRIDTVFASQKTRRVTLSAPVPVFLDYRTAFVDDDGRLSLRDDLYGLDADGTIVFTGKGLPPEPAPPVQRDAPEVILPPPPAMPQATAIANGTSPS
jgi:murein L,D-transpeptidase YcbB/YkuD